MKEYIYIIIGIAALIFNIYRKAQKNKANNPIPEAPQSNETERKPFVPKGFPQDLLDELDNAFGNKPEVTKESPIEISETELVNKEKVVDIKQEEINDIKIEKVKQIIKSKPKFKFNMKEAIIYNAILERKY